MFQIYYPLFLQVKINYFNLMLYHNAVAGPSGEVNVVWIAGHAAVTPLDVASHILAHRVYALAGTVGTCRERINSALITFFYKTNY